MKIEFELTNGRIVKVEKIEISATYATFLLMGDYASANEFVIETLESPKGWDEPKLLKILPPESELARAFKTTFYVLLESTPMSEDADFSCLTCVWLDNFDDSIPLGKLIESKLKNIDWENNAGDHNW